MTVLGNLPSLAVRIAKFDEIDKHLVSLFDTVITIKDSQKRGQLVLIETATVASAVHERFTIEFQVHYLLGVIIDWGSLPLSAEQRDQLTQLVTYANDSSDESDEGYYCF